MTKQFIVDGETLPVLYFLFNFEQTVDKVGRPTSHMFIRDVVLHLPYNGVKAVAEWAAANSARKNVSIKVIDFANDAQTQREIELTDTFLTGYSLESASNDAAHLREVLILKPMKVKVDGTEFNNIATAS